MEWRSFRKYLKPPRMEICPVCVCVKRWEQDGGRGGNEREQETKFVLLVLDLVTTPHAVPQLGATRVPLYLSSSSISLCCFTHVSCASSSRGGSAGACEGCVRVCVIIKCKEKKRFDAGHLSPVQLALHPPFPACLKQSTPHRVKWNFG